MATKGIKVSECRVEAGVVYARLEVTGAKISTGETKDSQSMIVSYTLLVKEKLEDVLEDAGSTWKIALANIRKKGIDAIAGLEGQEIYVSDIPTLTAGSGKGKSTLKMLMTTFGLSEEQARQVQKDPTLIRNFLS